MASIFTYDPDPPRLSSPWLATDQAKSQHESGQDVYHDFEDRDQQASCVKTLAKLSVLRLEAEPQQGPTEYKLHLLLRPRRRLISSTTGKGITGTHHARFEVSSPIASSHTTPRLAPVLQYSGSRQHRLEQLTTQLLWRLQQSSPYHSSTADSIILPSLPEATPQLQSPQQLARLLPGLEESTGALYEIGVADDGSLVGLTEDEMDESLNNLRAMAASLGCVVKIVRMVEVGECVYVGDEEHAEGSLSQQPRRGSLYVSEAYVKPLLDSREVDAEPRDHHAISGGPGDATALLPEQASHTISDKEQLRVSLTGATTSGKSSLLGTLSTATLDNGRGKSRLSLLKHRHEIASGMTSSVAQELIGYSDRTGIDGKAKVHVVNYATGNVSSWDDIHATSASGRLAFICDSAGHPRFRRTTVRGLVGWAPHWTLMCIAADTSSETKIQDSPTLLPGDDGIASASIANIAMAHLDLCLKLELPLVVVITKFDAATKPLLRQVLSDVLTMLKTAGRKPIMLSNDTHAVNEHDLQVVAQSDDEEVSKLCKTLDNDPVGSVPILFTSAIRGVGIGKLHALLRNLPVPNTPQEYVNSLQSNSNDHSPSVLFHVDDTFNLGSKLVSSPSDTFNNKVFIVSGHLSRGHISIGDTLLLGPFSSTTTTSTTVGDSLSAPHRSTTTTTPDPTFPFLSPRSFTDAFTRTVLPSRARPTDQEWLAMKVISIRNLRLPVRSLARDQAGTAGLVPVAASAQDLAIRKGMVLASASQGKSLEAAHAFNAAFGIAEAGAVVVGGIVIVYTAAVRAAAKVVAVQLGESDGRGEGQVAREGEDEGSNDGCWFKLDEELEDSATATATAMGILVTFQFLTSREWVQVGAKVLVMPGGGAGTMGTGGGGQEGRSKHAVAGLEGFVGRVVERFG